MSNISLQTFRNLVTANVRGFVDVDHQGGLTMKNTGRFFHSDISDPVRNGEIRAKLFTALTASAPNLPGVFVKKLADRLVSNYEELSHAELRSIISEFDAEVEWDGAFTSATELDSAAFDLDAESLKGLEKRASTAATGIFKADALEKAVPMYDRIKPAVREAMDKAAVTAEMALKQFYALKGSDLVNPAKKEYVDALVEQAAKALSELDGYLRKVAASVDNPPAGLLRLIDYCAARMTETAMVVAEVRADQEAGRPVDADISGAELMTGAASRMHGNRDVLGAMTAKSAALVARLDALRAMPAGTRVAEAELGKLQEELAAFRDTLKDIATNGVRIKDNTWDSGIIRPERTFLDALITGADEALADLAGLLDKNHDMLAYRFIDHLFPAEIPRERGVSQDQIDLAVHTREFLMRAVSKGVAKIDWEAFDRAAAGLENHPNESTKPLGCSSKAVLHAKRRLEQFVARMKDGASASSDLIGKMLAGKIGVGTVVGARLHGFSPENVDDRFDDRFLVKREILAKGSVSTVYRLTYRFDDGSEHVRIFKPEENAKIGLQGLMLGLTGYLDETRAATLNAATHRSAVWLGVPNATVGVTVGMHRGEIGFFMEEAPGLTNYKIRELKKGIGKHPENASLLGGFAPNAGFLKRPLVERRRTYASLVKGLNELEWLDWMTGQMDRHGDNYKVEQKPDGTYSVRGIDNDGSFSFARMGLWKFRLRGRHLEKVLANLGLSSVDELKKTFPDRVTLMSNGDPVIDIKDSPSLFEDVGHKAFGLNSCSRPTRIPRAVYDRLMALDRQRATDNQAIPMTALKLLGPCPVDNLKGQALYFNQIQAMTGRLEEMIEHAKALRKEEEDAEAAGKSVKRILDDADWSTEASKIIAGQSSLRENCKTHCRDLVKDGARVLQEEYDNFLYLRTEYFVRDFAPMLPVNV